MTKDVLLSIKGLQFNGATDTSDIETVTPAQYYNRNGHHYVVFDEASEGYQDITKSVIKWNGDSLDLTKKGAFNTHMVFEKNKKSVTDYRTPFGSILIGIDTKNISVEEEDKQIRLNVDYSLDVNYEFLADCRISMEVSSKS